MPAERRNSESPVPQAEVITVVTTHSLGHLLNVIHGTMAKRRSTTDLLRAGYTGMSAVASPEHELVKTSASESKKASGNLVFTI